MDRDLETLGDASGEFAAALDVSEGEFGDHPGFECGRENARGSDCVLNGEIDADASYGRHGVCGVADAEETGAVPAFEVVDLDGEELELVPISDFSYAVV